MSKQTFEVKLQRAGSSGVYFQVPFNVHEVFGTKAQVKVRGTIDGHTFRSSIMPMGGKHMMVVNKEMRETIEKKAGDKVKVVIEIDTSPRIVAVPTDLKKALGRNLKAKKFFEESSYTNQKEYVQWIKDAKKKETREHRIKEAIKQLAQGIKFS
ncbi:MAG: YdeI/OmpD-associated family protein [Bacteroidota bacterium]|nr:YdeI/OmpD-associated family protein [Bacteroidota bacterium]